MIDCLVTGAGGALGSVLVRQLLGERARVGAFVSPSGPAPQLESILRADLTDPASYRDRVLALAPRAIVHLAAVSKPSEAVRDPERARAVNVLATAALVELSAELGARFVYASTDMVFDGECAPYGETDPAEPLSVYGRTKLEGERAALAHPGALVVRFPLLYGVPAVAREPTFFEAMLAALQSGQSIRLFEDEVRTPLWLEDAASACIRLTRSELTGIIHVAGPESLSRLQMGHELAAALGCDPAPLRASRRADVPAEEPRPRDLSLTCARYAAHFGAPPGRDMSSAAALVASTLDHGTNSKCRSST